MLLAGPIVRRVETRAVSVWVASSEAVSLRLGLWEGYKPVGVGSAPFTESPTFESDAANTIRVGAGLHIGLMTLVIEEPDQLFAGHVYSYNVTAMVGSTRHDLRSWGLLAAGPLNGKAHEPLGYEAFTLPSFVTPPATIEDLRIYQGSCRKPHGPDPDALAFLDDEIKNERPNPSKRPHQLYLTGDQIYADEVPLSLLPHLTAVGETLIGGAEPLPFGPSGQVEVTQANLPAGFRQWFVENAAGFTSVSADSHLLSLGEYCAAYLFGWSNTAWPNMGDRDPETQIPASLAPFEHEVDVVRMSVEGMRDLQIALFKDPESDEIPSQRLVEFFYGLTSEQRNKILKTPKKLFQFTGLQSSVFADELEWDKVRDSDHQATDGYDFLLAEARVLISGETEEEGRRKLAAFVKYAETFQELFEEKSKDSFEQAKRTVTLYDTLPKVRRALANVATYMLFDDHDVTDDWNINRAWRTKVHASRTGRTVVRNALIAYGLFQGWGNDPARFATGEANESFLENAARYYATGSTPDTTAVTALDSLFGLDDGESEARWDFTVPGSVFHVHVLDTRTRREFFGLQDPPNLLHPDALEDQLPLGPSPLGKQLLILVCPVPVLGIPLIDELFRPLAARAADFSAGKGATKLDVESWSANSAGLEVFLARLATYEHVLILSGDVHYSAGATMDYWRKDFVKPSRFVEFTSSALKNIIPLEDFLEQPELPFKTTLGQRALRLGVPLERLGWLDAGADPVELSTTKPTPPTLRARLRRSPVLIPSHIWPSGTSLNRPIEWSWRLRILADQRPDSERPEAVQPLALDGPVEASDPFIGYRRVARRHVAFLDSALFARRLVLATNLGRVTFSESEDGNVTARHDILAVHAADPLRRYEAYTRHEASLAPSDENRPVLEVQNG